MNDFNVYQHLLLIFAAVSVNCDTVDFCPSVFYTVLSVCAAHLKGVVVNLASTEVS